MVSLTQWSFPWMSKISVFQCTYGASQVAQWWKNSPANAGDMSLIPGLGRSPGGGNGNPSSIHAWKIPWTEEPGGYSPWGLKESDTTEHAHMHTKIPLRASPLICLTILCFKCWKCSWEQNKSQQSLCIQAAPTSLCSPWRRFTFSFALCKQLMRMYRDQGIF